MSTVYVVQKQQHFDHKRGELVDKFDFTPAKEHGELFYLLSPTAAPFKHENVLQELKDGLCNFTERDFLLLTGNPVLIGLASAVAADIAGTVNFLQWSGKDQRYLPIKVDVFTDC